MVNWSLAKHGQQRKEKLVIERNGNLKLPNITLYFRNADTFTQTCVTDCCVLKITSNAANHKSLKNANQAFRSCAISKYALRHLLCTNTLHCLVNPG